MTGEELMDDWSGYVHWRSLMLRAKDGRLDAIAEFERFGRMFPKEWEHNAICWYNTEGPGHAQAMACLHELRMGNTVGERVVDTSGT